MFFLNFSKIEQLLLRSFFNKKDLKSICVIFFLNCNLQFKFKKCCSLALLNFLDVAKLELLCFVLKYVPGKKLLLKIAELGQAFL